MRSSSVLTVHSSTQYLLSFVYGGASYLNAHHANTSTLVYQVVLRLMLSNKNNSASTPVPVPSEELAVSEEEQAKKKKREAALASLWVRMASIVAERVPGMDFE
eukprot:518688-Rhodomonas_salina.1